MDTDTRTVEPAESFRYTWLAGVVGGLAGGLGMGGVLHAGANLMPFVGALYGWPTVPGGWVAHMVNSVLFGLLFALLVSRPVVRDGTVSLASYVAYGVVYAAAVGLVTTGILVPIAMNAVGTRSLPEPLVPLPGVLGGLLVVVSIGVAHVVYGLILGATYGLVQAVPGSTGGHTA